MAITLTEAAAKKAKELIEEYGYIGVRLGIKGGGCAGFEYAFSLADQEHEGDIVGEQHGVKIFCDKKSYLFVNGTTIDHETTLVAQGFKFLNPNSKGGCGCGSSFSV